MKVFPDTNVLVSAVTTRGICADVLREVFSVHELFISEHIVNEVRTVLRKKFGIHQELIDNFIEILSQDTTMVSSGYLPEISLQDKDDLPVLGAAINSGAEILVTGDKELLDLCLIEGLQIRSPRQFWEMVKSK